MKKRIILCIFMLSVLVVYTCYQSAALNYEKLLYVLPILIIVICVVTVLEYFNSSFKVSSDFISKESFSENDYDYKQNFEKSLALFQKERENELSQLLEELDDARAVLSESIKSGDIKKVSDAEKCLNSIIDRLMTFLENYSKFGEMIHRKINRFKTDKS